MLAAARAGVIRATGAARAAGAVRANAEAAGECQRAIATQPVCLDKRWRPPCARAPGGEHLSAPITASHHDMAVCKAVSKVRVSHAHLLATPPCRPSPRQRVTQIRSRWPVVVSKQSATFSELQVA